jgi:hypothetical protein
MFSKAFEKLKTAVPVISETVPAANHSDPVAEVVVKGTFIDPANDLQCKGCGEVNLLNTFCSSLCSTPVTNIINILTHLTRKPTRFL